MQYTDVLGLQPFNITKKDKAYLDTLHQVGWSELNEGLYTNHSEETLPCTVYPKTVQDLLRLMKSDQTSGVSPLVRPETTNWEKYLGQFPENIITKVVQDYDFN
jgi:hypothetical protein